MRAVLLTFALSLGLCAASDNRFDNAAAKIIDSVNALDADALFKMYNGQMQDALPAARTKSFLIGLQGQFGKIEKIESSSQVSDMTKQYRLKMQRGGSLNLEFSLDSSDKIAGLFFKPAAVDMSAAASVKHETRLHLPFRGQWLIFWGGDTPELGGHHLQAPGQRFAFDILGVGPDGKTRKGDGGKNEDYYAFGREILAPADGVVTDVITGVRDNKPGVLNPYSAVGNAVLIEHQTGEVSVLAHLKLGSIAVKQGDRVKQGQLIGLCGNSGNSSEPHLHYHLQNSTSLAEGVGVKVGFASVNVTRNGNTERKSEYSPIKGDIVSE